MNTEYLLDAIGLLDDDLIQEAEACSAPKRRSGCRSWMSLAACLAVVVVLGYGLAHIRLDSSKNTAFPSGGAPSASASNGVNTPGAPPQEPAGSNAAGGSNGLTSGSGEPASSDPPLDVEGPCGGYEGDFCAAIMVDGVLYWSTGTPVPGEVEESAIRTVTGYTSSLPEMDGQTNFSHDLSAQYAVTNMGLVVLVDQEWILFDPVPPWEK